MVNAQMARGSNLPYTYLCCYLGMCSTIRGLQLSIGRPAFLLATYAIRYPLSILHESVPPGLQTMSLLMLVRLYRVPLFDIEQPRRIPGTSHVDNSREPHENDHHL